MHDLIVATGYRKKCIFHRLPEKRQKSSQKKPKNLLKGVFVMCPLCYTLQVKDTRERHSRKKCTNYYLSLCMPMYSYRSLCMPMYLYRSFRSYVCQCICTAPYVYRLCFLHATYRYLTRSNIFYFVFFLYLVRRVLLCLCR